MYWKTLSLGTLVFALAGAGALAAQDFPLGPPGGDPGLQEDGPPGRQDWRQARREEMRRKIEIIRIARLTDELNLDGETAARLIPLLTRFDQVDKDHRESSAAIGRELKQLTEADPVDEAALRATIKRWWDNEAAHQQQRRAIFEETRDVLSVEQQARLMLFVPRFQREVREIVREYTQWKRGNRPGGNRPGPGGFDGPPPGAGGDGGPGPGGPPPDGRRWWEEDPSTN